MQGDTHRSKGKKSFVLLAEWKLGIKSLSPNTGSKGWFSSFSCAFAGNGDCLYQPVQI